MLTIERDDRPADLRPVRSLLERYDGTRDPASDIARSKPRRNHRLAFLFACCALVAASGAAWLVRRHEARDRATSFTATAPASTRPLTMSVTQVSTSAAVIVPAPPPSSSPPVTARIPRFPRRAPTAVATSTRLVYAGTTPATAAAPPNPATDTAPQMILGGLAARPPF